jgi:hypothetical protein
VARANNASLRIISAPDRERTFPHRLVHHRLSIIRRHHFYANAPAALTKLKEFNRGFP